MSEVADFNSISGKGVTGVVDRVNVAFGNKKLMDQFNINSPEDAENRIKEDKNWVKRYLIFR